MSDASTRWFSVAMGTGIVSILLHILPYNGYWLQWIAKIIFAVNVFLFVAGCILSIIRYSLYPHTFKAVISHPVQSMFLGTFPMGLSTIIDMICFVCIPAWGPWAGHLAWALWIIDTVISIVCALSLPFLLYVTPPLRKYFLTLSCKLIENFTACHLMMTPIFHP